MRDFELEPLQRVRFWNEEYTTCQINNLKIIDVPDSDQRILFVVKISTTIVYDVLYFELKKNLTVRFLVREFCKKSHFNFNFIKQIRLRETIVYSWSESEVNFFQGQFLKSGKVFSDYDIKYLRLVRDFELNPLQRVSIWNEKFELCQNLDLKNNNVTEFEKPSSSMCQKRKQNISQRNRFELKKNRTVRFWKGKFVKCQFLPSNF